MTDFDLNTRLEQTINETYEQLYGNYKPRHKLNPHGTLSTPISQLRSILDILQFDCCHTYNQIAALFIKVSPRIQDITDFDQLMQDIGD